MDIKDKIKSSLKEAELYRGQGLLSESRSKYQQTLELIKSQLSPQDGEKIAKAIVEKITVLEQEIMRVEKKVLSPHMTKESQDLITQMFRAAEGEDHDLAALEGAKALMKFGQFQRARSELEKLLCNDAHRIEAARHIMNCYFLENKPDDAVACYQKWLSDPVFTDSQMAALQKFVEKNFLSKGVTRELPVRTKPREVAKSMGKEAVQQAERTGAADAPPKKEKTALPAPEKKIVAPPEKVEDEFEEFDILTIAKKTKKK
jgi:tetratricopeptide (TPR) repeat protein